MQTHARIRTVIAVTTLTLAAGLIALAADPAPAAELRAGVVYPGGTLVDVAEYGVSITVPPGWQGELGPSEEFFVLRSPGVEAAVFVSVEEMGAEQARRELAAPIDLGDGVVLAPTGVVEEGEGFLAVDADASGVGRPLKAHMRAVVPRRGLIVVVLALTPPEATQSARDLVASVAGTLLFREPEASGVQADPGGDSGSGDRWDTYLAGKYLARYYSNTGFTSERHLWLCSDGTFGYKDQSGGFGGGASGAFAGGWTGRWTATGTGNHGVLTLRFDDGSVSEYELEYRDDKVLLDGQRWLRGTNEHCT